MSLFNSLARLLVVMFVLISSSVALAQGTAEDYERASELVQKYNRAYQKQPLDFQWIEDGILLKTKNNRRTLFRFFDGQTGKTEEASTLKDLSVGSESTTTQSTTI